MYLGYTFNGRLVILSMDATKDRKNLGVDQRLLQEILEEGEECRDSRMSRGEIGRAVRKAGLIYFVKLIPYAEDPEGEEYRLVKHTGIARAGR